ncbi:MAG: hypothetical protein GYA51_17880 [Candidatus Methanofastidiosa archaeon]|nr:hypothetical protein [Candidatus Methanofastidiosa archaeon]
MKKNEFIYPDEQVECLEKKIEKELKKLLSLSKKQKKKKLEDIKSMIKFYENSTNIIEDRRNKVGELSWQSLLLGLTAIGALSFIKMPSVILWSLILLIAFFIFSQILKIREFYAQSDFGYPFNLSKRYSNKWKWFYYGNKKIMNISINPFTITRTYKDDIENYLEGLDFFIKSYRKETVDVEIKNNIIQLYLLQVHNYYKNKFYLRLVNLECRWYKIMGIVSIVLLALNIFLPIILNQYYHDVFSNLYQIKDIDQVLTQKSL